MPANFVNIDRDTPFLLPPDMREWVAYDDLVHFILEAVPRVDLHAFSVNRRGSGSQQFPPQTLLALLIYCYSLKILSSRKIEIATYRDVGVRYLMGNRHVDHNTINRFRKNNKQAFRVAFLEVLKLASEIGILKVGCVSVDGTRLPGSASKSRNLRYDRADALSQKLQADIDELLRLAEEADSTPPDDGDRLPEKLAYREALKKKIDAAKTRMEQRAREQARADTAARQADYEQRLAEREQRIAEGQKRPGRVPAAPAAVDPTPASTMQSNLTDPDSRMLARRGGPSVQGYNAQLAVDTATMLVLNTFLVQSTDMGQLGRAVDGIDSSLGRPDCVLADSGYLSSKEIKALEAAGMDPHIALGSAARRQYDFTPEPTSERKIKAPGEGKHADPSLVAMKTKLETDEGRRRYALRQQTVEPVIGIIKDQGGMRRLERRGLEEAESEWTLGCLAYNVKRLATLVRQNKAG